MASLNCPIKYSKVKVMSFYPLWLSMVTFIVIKKTFNYDEEKFYEMGKFCFKSPNIIRIWTKYLVSFKKAVESSSQMWKLYFTSGDAKVPDYSEEKKYAILRLENFPIYTMESPRTYCSFLAGYFSSIIKILTGTKTSGEEIQCVYKGDEHHDFLLKWK